MTASAFDHDEHESFAVRALKLGGVAGLHLALAAWLWHAQSGMPSEPVPLRMAVRTIVLPPQKEPEPPKPIAPQPKPVAQVLKVPKAPPQATEHHVARRAAPATTPAVLTAAPSAEQAPASFAVAAPPSAPAKESAVSAPAPAVVTAARFDADYLHNPAPAYPAMSRKLREEGKVLLQVKVTPAGLAEQVQIKQGSGFPRLDDAALATVRQWRFVPARRGDEAVTASVVVPIVFRLDS